MCCSKGRWQGGRGSGRGGRRQAGGGDGLQDVTTGALRRPLAAADRAVSPAKLSTAARALISIEHGAAGGPPARRGAARCNPGGVGG